MHCPNFWKFKRRWFWFSCSQFWWSKQTKCSLKFSNVWLWCLQIFLQFQRLVKIEKNLSCSEKPWVYLRNRNASEVSVFERFLQKKQLKNKRSQKLHKSSNPDQTIWNLKSSRVETFRGEISGGDGGANLIILWVLLRKSRKVGQWGELFYFHKNVTNKKYCPICFILGVLHSQIGDWTTLP